MFYFRMFNFEIVLEGRENDRLQNVLGSDSDYPEEFPKPVNTFNNILVHVYKHLYTYILLYSKFEIAHVLIKFEIVKISS